MTEESTLWVLDFDGTLYRGWFARFAGGVSNTDLFWGLVKRSRGLPRIWRLLAGGWRVHRLHSRLRRRRRAGLVSQGDVDAACIEAFRELLRRETSEAEVESVGELLAAGLDPHACRTLRRWLAPMDQVVVLSKAFLPVLCPACVRLSACLDRPVDVVGNSLGDVGGILRAEDKQRALAELLDARHSPRSVVIGDTEEDVAMVSSLVERGSETRLVAVAPKDCVIRASADLVLSSWRAAGGHPFGD